MREEERISALSLLAGMPTAVDEQNKTRPRLGCGASSNELENEQSRARERDNRAKLQSNRVAKLQQFTN